ncbi:putative polyketide synthase [Microdochium trichocladiopsis]|uniref:Polyketide synthase n=1 Tax=Microdochium trichocladiopsis TaxID=1682393 RepID=A0A9P8YFC0_9PEZI|nr:putative polyketide synthase [Microdochium trichocladiopsis]KAH7038405.1 putative polyketide synthase [Microdochium trichocladiopsis]
MDRTEALAVASRVTLLFGWQALSLDEQKLVSIRQTVHGSSSNSWILDTVADLAVELPLPPSLTKDFEGRARLLLGHLARWLQYRDSHSTDFVRYNTLLTPLTIIHHLLQYSAYLEAKYPDLDVDARFAAAHLSHKALGFCTGLISAYAVSNAHDVQSFRSFGSTALRLAVACGLIVDEHNHASPEAQTTGLAVAWQASTTQQEIGQVMSQFPETYHSVQFDENRLTLTVLRHQRDDMKQHLQATGLTAVELDFDGRFHWPGHKTAAEAFMSTLDKEPLLQNQDASMLTLPVSTDTESTSPEAPHRSVIRSVLLEAPNWYESVRRVQEKTTVDGGAVIVTFGFEKFMPPSLMRLLKGKVLNMTEIEQHYRETVRPSADTDIAVVGMSCKVAGAEDLDEFWRILCNGKSQHQKVPSDRFKFDTPFRESASDRSWFGNFIDDHDAFDHKFFKKAPREVASMDPQQRQFLQVAYQAVQQSGYFRTADPDRRVGCYVGMSAVDYENNVACHAPNAYSATGTLRGFVAGKVSHFFGWTGPGLTLDTACSSSAVAVHLACQAILNGECSAAVAGGVNIMTSPLFFQNLGAASFLSKTGQCKPFDAAADGYCRGEGCGAVFLKKLSSALADGDTIHGVITGTAVQQNENCTPIVVPNVPSLSDLFAKVVAKSHLRPEQIGVVEAHGTGTAVGDPAEYDSVRKVFGGSACGRTSQLMLGSVKGLVGHLEATSGIVSLIKSLLMIKHGLVPPQASFTRLNPAINAVASDLITIPTTVTPWTASLRAVLINNYGASGSNASMVVTGPPRRRQQLAVKHQHDHVEAKRPFRLTGLDSTSIKAYAAKLRRVLQQSPAATIDDIAFNMAQQANSTLPRHHVFTSRTAAELDERLAALSDGRLTELSHDRQPLSVPVVLCFGGQVAKSVVLDRRLFDSALVLRTQLEECDTILQSLGASSIFPHIFQRDPIDDIVILQTCLFSLQFASAQAWMSCGIRPVAVMGHSFGELTAMAVAGVLPLAEAIKMVLARSRIIRDQWVADKGGMLAVEASLEDARLLVQLTNAAAGEEEKVGPIAIACHNGPRSFTLAGSTASIDRAVEIVTDNRAGISVKMKRLDVTHAFHSALTEPLLSALDDAASGVSFAPPKIEWMRCTETAANPTIPATFFSQHLRQPVFFDHCARRVASKYPQCVWLEAGSNSTVTNMISRALGRPPGSTFVSVNLSNDTACDQLADTTATLWTAGVDLTYWLHHRSQSGQYASLLLPPYQFTKSRHWLELKKAPAAALKAPDAVQPEAAPVTWLTFLGYQDGAAQRQARFRINTSVPRFQTLMAGHKTAQTAPICPATVQMDLAIDAMSQIVSLGTDFNPEITNISNSAPICDDPSAQLWLDLQATDTSATRWQFTVSSTGAASTRSPTVHTTGIIVPSAKNLSTEADLSRYQRVVSHKRCLEVLDCPDPDEVMQGRVIYKAFAEVVEYDEQYRGVAKLVAKGLASAGRVAKEPSTASWFDAHLSDTFCQVGGIFLNCMTDRSPGDIFICRGLERWMRSATLQQNRRSSYDVLALHDGSTESGSFLTDVFVFDPETGVLVEAILGLNFVRVQKQAIAKTLVRLTGSSAAITQASTAMVASAKPKPPAVPAASLVPVISGATTVASPKRTATRRREPDDELLDSLKAVVSELAGVQVAEIQRDSLLADLGVDSLMGMELVRELEIRFQCTLSLDDASGVTDMGQLVDFVRPVARLSSSEGPAETHRDHDHGYTDSDESQDEARATSRGSITITPAETEIGSRGVDIVNMLAGLVGVEATEVSPGTVLCELGVDSLMSMELRAALNAECGVNLDDQVAVEGMTVSELDALVNGPCSPANPEPVTKASILSPDAQTSGSGIRDSETLTLGIDAIMATFGEVKAQTDRRIDDAGCATYAASISPMQDDLCVSLTLEAFAQLGCSLEQAMPGESIQLPVYPAAHTQLVRHLCRMIEKRTGILTCVDDMSVARTSQPYSIRPSSAILAELAGTAPQESTANDLIYYVGSHLAELLRGQTDGIKLIFGCERGRSLVAAYYAEWPLHRLCYRHVEAFLESLAGRLSSQASSGPLKIMEMGAGTGGTTRWLVPLLARIGRPVEYTFTDVSSSLVIQARKRYQADYPFMRFQTHDIEKEPAAELVGSQNIVIASNAVHATHDLVRSTGNIRKVLQPNGVLLMVEMTRPPFWVDLVFGVFKGWWLFEDGRSHALADEGRWRQALEAAGFGFTDWTGGSRPESEMERLVIAVAAGRQQKHQAVSPSSPRSTDPRQAAVDKYIDWMSSDLLRDVRRLGKLPAVSGAARMRTCVLVTGGTGSLGSHLVAELAERTEVDQVIVLNRKHSVDAMARQLEAFTSRHISLGTEFRQKLRVIATDTSKPSLGLTPAEYASLAASVTHIIHSAWAMSIKRPIHGFESQFDIMRNLVRLAVDAADASSTKVHFQFVSSIAVVGHYPLRPGRGGPHVPEDRVELADVLPNGYGDAKFACERMLDETLHHRPDRFAATCVRIGQIAGASRGPGYWNPHEHLPFLLKSSQTLRCLPQLSGLLSWTPVDTVAGTLTDIVLLSQEPFPVYHVDNPVRQQWSDMLPVLAQAMRVASGEHAGEISLVPLQHWVELVRSKGPSGPDGANPAFMLIDFLQDNFERMSCGGLLLGTAHSQKHSWTLASTGPVTDTLVRKYVDQWKSSGFLQA